MTHEKVIVSDAGPLIALAKLDRLDLLFCSFSEIHVPKAVYLETTADRHRLDSQRIESFVKKHAFMHEDVDDDHYGVFSNMLDKGESQALALATQLNCGILIDERLGRFIAKQHAIPVVGVMGVLLQAKTKGKIETIQPLIERLLRYDYRLSDKVINIVLRRAGEL